MRALLGIFLAISLAVGWAGAAVGQAQRAPYSGVDDLVESEAARFYVEQVTADSKIPWSMAVLPGMKAAILADRLDGLSWMNLQFGVASPLQGPRDLYVDIQQKAGAFHVALHPDFENNGWVYLSYAVGHSEQAGLKVSRFQLGQDGLEGEEVIFDSRPRTLMQSHFGGRFVFQDGYIYISVGEGEVQREEAQNLGSHLGSIIRLHDDGRVPDDNPFVGQAGALPEIWAYGLRNPQGMALHPDTGDLWVNEHGPQGGDEINHIEPGKNYGWPVITYGEEYGGGPVGEGLTALGGMEQPFHHWANSIAPGGLMIYGGDLFPGWRGDFFSGAMARTHINRLTWGEGQTVHEERLVTDQNWRVRFILEAPDGTVFFGVDWVGVFQLVPPRAP